MYVPAWTYYVCKESNMDKSVGGFRSAFAERMRAFFMGRIYPVAVCLIVVIGYIFGLEFYLHLLNMALVICALMVCDSMRPVIVVLCTFVFQISKINSPANYSPEPGGDTSSGYYFEGGRLVILIISFVLVFAAFVVFFVKNKLVNGRSLRALPMLIPTGALTLAFLMGGVFSGAWVGGSLGFSLIQIVCWFVIPYAFILGFKNERGEELLNYFVYVASLIVIVLLVELGYTYITTEGLVTSSGTFARWLFHYGWGNCNTAAQAFVVFIPVLFIGTRGGKMQIYYFAMATLAFVGAVLNVSRSAALVGGVAYFVCLIISFIFSKSKKRYIVEIALVIIGAAVALLLTWDTVSSALLNYVDRGTTDSGRFNIWKKGFSWFLEAPVFGYGFFGDPETVFGATQIDFLPNMMHNTVIQFLACFGIFGILAYGFYRLCSLRPFVRRPSYVKTMLGAALLTVLGGSLLDNFIFNILPMFSYGVIVAVVYKLEAEECGEKKFSLL